MNTSALGKELRDGIYYFLAGQGCFLRDRDLWKYAVLPLLFMLLFYVVLIGGTVFYLRPWLAENLAKTEPRLLREMLCHLSVYLLMGAGIFIVWATQSVLYQCFGAVIFDQLSDYYERKEFGYACRCSSPQRRKAEFESWFLSFRNFLLGSVLLFLSLGTFGWAAIICTPLMGYLLGVSYFQACAVNHGISVRKLTPIMHKHFLTISVFGTCSALAQVFPLSSFILTPGFIVGGCRFYWDNIHPELIAENSAGE